jgi:hypothetical protein
MSTSLIGLASPNIEPSEDGWVAEGSMDEGDPCVSLDLFLALPY